MWTGYNMGELRVSLEARFLINDGQHRRAAIEEALKQRPELTEPSHVIAALGYGDDRAHSAIRIGLGRQNTQDEIEYATQRIVQEATRLRSRLTGAAHG
jgi:cysteine sulfinate desulfinase/cysteine desulfurase-like protein